MHGRILRQCDGAGRRNSYPKKKAEIWCLEILKTGVDKAAVNKEVKPCALAVGQLLQRAVFDELHLLQAPAEAW